MSDESNSKNIESGLQESVLHQEHDDLIWPVVVDKISEEQPDLLVMRPSQNTKHNEYDGREIIAINNCELESPVAVASLGKSSIDGTQTETDRVEKTLLDVYAIITKDNVSRKDLQWKN